MQNAFYSVWIPFEVGDIIKGNNSDLKYEVMDILHTYSMIERNVVDVSFKLRDIITNEEKLVEYSSDNWKIVK